MSEVGEVLDPVVTPEPDEWIFLDKAPEETGPTKEELLKQVQESKAVAEALQAQLGEMKNSTNQTIASGLQKVAEMVKAPAGTVAVEEEPIDFAEIDKQFYDAPSKHTVEIATSIAEKLQKKKLDPLFSEMLTMHLNTSKREAVKDDDYGWVLENYKDEVQQVISSSTRDALMQTENPYLTAAQIVAGRHVKEIRMAAIAEEQKKAKAAAPARVPFTETSSVSAAGSNGKKTIVLTDEMRAFMETARVKGLDPKEAVRRKYGYQS